MTIRVEQVTLPAPTVGTPGVTTQVFTFAGLGAASDIKLAVFEVSQGAAVDTPKSPQGLGMGATDGTTQRCLYEVARGGRADARTYRNGRADACVNILSASGGDDGRASFDAFVTDGVRLVWDEIPGAAKQITATLFADDGEDLQVKVGQAASSATLGGTNPISTGIAGEIGFMLTFGGNHPFDGGLINGSMFSAGVLWNPGTGNGGLRQRSLTWGSGYDAPAADPYAYFDTTHAVCLVDETTAQQKVAFLNFDSSGGCDTILQGAAGAIEFCYVAVSFGPLVRPWVGTLDTPTATGELDNSGPGFLPQIVGLGMSQLTAANTYRENAEAGSIGFGLMTATEESSLSVTDQDAADPTVCDSLASSSAAELRTDAGAASLEAVAATTRFNSTGFRLNWTAVEASARKWFAWALSVSGSRLAGVVEMAGVSALSGLLRRRRPLASTTAATSGLTATMRRRRATSATVGGSSAVTATAVRRRRLVATIAAVSTVAATATTVNNGVGASTLPAVSSSGTGTFTAAPTFEVAGVSALDMTLRRRGRNFYIDGYSAVGVRHFHRRRRLRAVIGGTSQVEARAGRIRPMSATISCVSTVTLDAAGSPGQLIATIKGYSQMGVRMGRRRPMYSTIAAVSTFDVAAGLGSTGEPTPPSIPYPTSIDFDAYPNRVEFHGGSLIANTTSPIQYLLENGYLDDGGAVGIFGKIRTDSVRGAHGTKVLEPIHLVGMDDNAGFNRFNIGKGAGGYTDCVCWNLTFVNEANAFAPITTDDDESGNPVEPAGMLHLMSCRFRGEPDAYIWHGVFPAKWWVNGKGSASYNFQNCIFPPVLEHHHYLHYAQEGYFVGNLYQVTGGTAGQFASRAGRPPSGPYNEFYFGNPYQPPAGSLGPLLIKNCVHDDGTEFPAHEYRDGSSFTVVGWINDVWIIGCTVRGNAVGAIVIWTDYYKGAHTTDGEIYISDVGDPPPPSARTHKQVYIRNLTVESGDHDRAIVMVAGCEGFTMGSGTIDTVRPELLIDSEYGGTRENGAFSTTEFCFEDEQFINDYVGGIGTYIIPSDSTHWYTLEELQAHLCLPGPSWEIQATSFASFTGGRRRRLQSVAVASMRPFFKLRVRRPGSFEVAAVSALEFDLQLQAALSATLAGVSDFFATLHRRRVASSSLPAASTVEGTLTRRRLAAFDLAGVSDADFTLGLQAGTASFTIASASTVGGTLVRRRRMAATVAASSTVELDLAVAPKAGSFEISAASGVSATLRRRRVATASIAGTSSLAFDLSLAQVAGTVTISTTSSVTLALHRRRQGAASVDGASGASASVHRRRRTSSSVAALSDASFDLALAPIEGTFEISATSGVSCTLRRRRVRSAVVAASSSLEQVLYRRRALEAEIAGESGMDLTMIIAGHMAVEIAGVSSLSFRMRRQGGAPGPETQSGMGRIRTAHAARGVVAVKTSEPGRVRLAWKETVN